MKEIAIELIKQFPDDVDISDIIDDLYVKANIYKGLQDVEQGRVYTMEEVERHIADAFEAIK